MTVLVLTLGLLGTVTVAAVMPWGLWNGAPRRAQHLQSVDARDSSDHHDETTTSRPGSSLTGSADLAA
ncbi:MAG: hypothetical protein ACKVHU_12355 [Acidimicrobiales bacterium]|jgi:hypothetical protein